MRFSSRTLLIVAMASASTAYGETFFKCFDADGVMLSEQLYPCDKGQKQVRYKNDAAPKAAVALPTQSAPQGSTSQQYGGASSYSSSGSGVGVGGNAYTMTNPNPAIAKRNDMSQDLNSRTHQAMKDWGAAMAGVAKERIELRNQSAERDLYKSHLSYCLEMKRIQASSNSSPIVDDCAEYATSKSKKAMAGSR
jgi:hypothetical protein